MSYFFLSSRKGTINGDPDPTEDSDDPADGYEVLDERELDDDDENIQFFDGQDLRFESSDIMEDHLLPSLTDDEITKERKEIHLKPKERCLIPVVVGSGKVDLCWEFISHPKVNNLRQILIFPLLVILKVLPLMLSTVNT